jgi:hypothetical protein
MMSDWNKTIGTMLEMTREHEKAPAWALTMKLSEEVGELSEIMLYELGHLHHKKDKDWKDTPVEEAADIMNVLLGLMSVHYPKKTPEELSWELLDAMIKKGMKYGRIIGADDDLFTR